MSQKKIEQNKKKLNEKKTIKNDQESNKVIQTNTEGHQLNQVVNSQSSPTGSKTKEPRQDQKNTLVICSPEKRVTKYYAEPH